MDSFEFVQIAVSIVLGFGISEILAGWGYQLRHRAERDFSGLQLVASAYLLAWSFRYLWIQWYTQPETWSYGAYLLAAVPAVVLALAAHVSGLDEGTSDRDAKQQYERTRLPLAILLALFPLFSLGRSYWILGDLRASNSLPIFIVTSAAFVWIAATSRTRDQWIAWGIAWAMLLLLIIFNFRTLGPQT